MFQSSDVDVLEYEKNNNPIVYESFLDSAPFEVLDGNNGGPYVLPGGLHSVVLNAETSRRFSFEVTVTCTHPLDYIYCDGTLFNSGSGEVLTTVTSQGSCNVAGTFASGSFTSVSTRCLVGTTYNLNFTCINQSTFTATRGSVASRTQSFVCAG